MQEKVALLFIDTRAEVCKSFTNIAARKVKCLYVARSGIEGVRELERSSYNVVVTKLDLRDINGVALLQKIRAIDPYCYVIASVGKVARKVVLQALEAGFDDFIVEPFSSESITLALAKASGRSCTDCELREQIILRKSNQEKLELLDKLKVQNNELEERIKKILEEIRLKDQIVLQKSKQAALGELTLMIAHQWNQPINALNAVLQNIDQICSDNPMESQLAPFILQGRDLLKEMSNTVNDFKEFFRPNKPKQRFEITPSIEQIVNMVAPLYIREKIELILTPAPGNYIYGSPSELGQCILNVLQNAKDTIIERAPLKRWVAISTAINDEYVSISIEDSGGGVDEKIMSKIFEPYFTTKPQGLGIGLHIVKTIIENNFHGALLIKNTDSGFMVTMYLPLEVPIASHYCIDSNDKIVDTSEDWNRFASSNNGEACTSEKIIGESIWNYIGGKSEAMWMKTLLDRTRLLRKSTTSNYRCDSPHLKRYIEMKLSPRDEEICIEHTLVKTEFMLRPFHFTAPNDYHPKNKRCSICNRISLHHGSWEEPDTLIAKGLIDQNIPLEVIHGICPKCSEELHMSIVKSAK